ncbi:MAG: hypothetical protein V3V28_04470 [Polaribacter sp.]|uniref:hypothetical protein n=1 Tax=Polaribacter sp. TaxID=1920175 RepID=UPI002F35A116
MKEIENEKLSIIYNELESEKEISLQLKTIPQEIKLIERSTQQKLQKIKVDVLNIDFSFREIFY